MEIDAKDVRENKVRDLRSLSHRNEVEVIV